MYWVKEIKNYDPNKKSDTSIENAMEEITDAIS